MRPASSMSTPADGGDEAPESESKGGATVIHNHIYMSGPQTHGNCWSNGGGWYPGWHNRSDGEWRRDWRTSLYPPCSEGVPPWILFGALDPVCPVRGWCGPPVCSPSLPCQLRRDAS
jgi:hypothetical protein